jgi:glycine cleavage system aminomethyltransferase T
MSRYAVLLDESGVILDDGVIARLGEQRYYFTTTTTNSALVYRELQRYIAQWRLDCGIVNLTGAMAAMNLAGPRSREILSRVSEIALDDFAFPYLGAREGTIAGATVRVLRVGFVGELGFEIHVPAESAVHVWDALLAVGAGAGLIPFGVEAQRLLRLEKGHIIIGQDTDGLTTPLEAALDWTLKMDKPFFVGQRSLRAMQARPIKQKLTGFVLPTAYSGPSPSECHLVIREGKIAGRVTSVAYSPTLKHVIGLAMLAPELSCGGHAFSDSRRRRHDARSRSGRRAVLRSARRAPAPDARAAACAQAAAGGHVIRTSPLYDSLRRLDPTWGELNGMATARNLATRASAALQLADLSALRRTGLKGSAAVSWLQSRNVPVPSHANTWTSLDGGGLVARLGRSEFLLEDGPQGAVVSGAAR